MDSFFYKKNELIDKYQVTRQKTERLCAPLEKEDYVVQSTKDG